MSHDILDLPADKPKRHRLWFLGYGAMLLLVLGIVFKLMRWPFSQLLVLAGGAGLVLRNVLLVLLNRPIVMRVVLYYFGYSLLLVGIVGIWLNRGSAFRYLIIAAVAIFFVQFSWTGKKKKGP